MSSPMYPTQQIDCAVSPCTACDRAGRSSWRSRVEWHTEKLRRRARLRRLALRAVVAVVALAVLWVFCLAVVVGVEKVFAP